MHDAAPAAGGFLPHGFCYLWDRPLLLTHLGSDLLIGLSYVAISLSLVYLVYRGRNEIPFSVMFLAFGMFIVACGGTHFMEVWTLWHGSYWASAGVKVVTAVASVATAASMPVMVPRVLTTIRDAGRSRESAIAVGRAAALEESNASLRAALEEAHQARAAAQSLVDELRRTQQERDERERYFQRIFESDMMGVVFWGADGEIADANDGFLRTTGYSREDLTQGRIHWREMTPPEWLPLDERALGEIGLRGTCTPFEKEYWRKDGTRVPVLIGASAFEGVRTRGVAFVLDVSDRWAAEKALKASERSLATTLDSIGDAVIATDTHGRVVRMNPVAEQLTGWSRADAIGYPLEAVFHIVSEETGLEVEHPAARVLREGTVVGLANHTLLISRDGTERPIADSGAPIRELGGETSGVVLVFRDQTEERQHEATRIDAVRLAEENRRAQEATRLKSEFLANMSHELRTPLNAIIGFTQILHDGKVDPVSPEHHEYLGDVLTSAQHLLQIINDVLDLSKVEAGKLQFNPQSIDLPALIGEVLGTLRTGFAAKGLEVESHVDPAVADVVLDAGRFKQVLYNYVSNALKFTREGGRIAVRAVAEGLNFRVEVEDTGVGIAPEDMGRLFNVFEQLDSGASKRHAGTGLGLALVKRLVEAQGGSVGVRSTPGVGTTFHAVLPRQTRRATPSAGAQSIPGPHDGARTILVVEDEARDQAILVGALSRAGYAVETVATAGDALAMCRRRVFDAITLDLLLPDMNGLDVLRAIRTDARYRDVPVVIVTVAADLGTVAAFAVHDVLAKPLDPSALLATLERAGVQPRQPSTVLIVDDDRSARDLMAAALGQMGYRAVSAAHGERALAIARDAAPAAVVLDLLMPEMDGFQFLERFRLLPECRRVPVIIWSSKELTEDDRSRLRASAQGVILKGSASGDALIEALRAFLPGAPFA